MLLHVQCCAASEMHFDLKCNDVTGHKCRVSLLAGTMHIIAVVVHCVDLAVACTWCRQAHMAAVFVVSNALCLGQA